MFYYFNFIFNYYFKNKLIYKYFIFNYYFKKPFFVFNNYFKNFFMYIFYFLILYLITILKINYNFLLILI